MKRFTGLLLLLICLRAAFVYADLHDTANSADYLIISSSEIIQQNGWISDLADWRDDHERVSMIVSTEEIFTEFGDGTPLDTTLKEFLHYAYNNWQEPQLKDVFIIGHHDVVPSHLGELSEIPFISDRFYSWDPSDAEQTPLIAVGRLPWSPSFGVPLFNYFAKIESYESAEFADWQNRVLFITDTPTEYLNWAEIYGDPLSELFPDEFEIEKDYAGYPVGDPAYGDHETVIDNLNIGCFLTAYFGFSGRTGADTTVAAYWSDSLYIDSVSVAALNNSDRMPLVIGIQRDLSPNPLGVSPLLWSFISNPNGGSIAHFAYSGVAFVGATQLFREYLFQELLAQPAATLGSVWRRSTVGEASYQIEHNLLIGDPGLRLPDHHLPADEPPNTALPNSIELLGNYPNPFNSTTTIQYQLSNSAKMSLAIYNVEGREVATLVEGLQSAGEHSIEWNAQGQSSGIYFVTLKSGGNLQTKKMVFLK